MAQAPKLVLLIVTHHITLIIGRCASLSIGGAFFLMKVLLVTKFASATTCCKLPYRKERLQILWSNASLLGEPRQWVSSMRLTIYILFASISSMKLIDDFLDLPSGSACSPSKLFYVSRVPNSNILDGKPPQSCRSLKYSHILDRRWST
jgi:hypothetical protein